MQQNIWFTPEGLEDLLPDEATKLEFYRRQLLDGFALSGYELVLPPIAEFTDSLLTGTGRHLAVDTCRFTDQESGKMMGVRADMTPQVARIATNRLAKGQVSRLCYVGEVLKTRNNKAKGSRSPIQVGAELFGHSGVESDIEVIELMLSSLNAIGLNDLTLSLGQVSIVDELMAQAKLDEAQQSTLVSILQRKAIPEYQEFTAELSLTAELQAAFDALLTLCGDVDTVLNNAAVLKAVSSEMTTFLGRVEEVVAYFKNYPGLKLHVDLADIRGYQYHTGMIFSCYAAGKKMYQLAKGGRYDGIGSEFGAAEPATGFSLDLRSSLDLLATPAESSEKTVWAPNGQEVGLVEKITELKAQNVCVTRFYNADELAAGSEYLAQENGQWQLVTK